MVNSIKKVFTSLVAMLTILSSIGFGSLGFASAASAATTGDLIKASGPAVYYYAADGKRYVFPNEKTYSSWFKDFSTVKTITDAELANISIGGNVTIRPGTKLVKITTDPKTYAVTPGGVLHWIESETVAKALYGDAWAQRVVDVPDAFFVNYTVGSSVPTAIHPDGQLVQYAGDSNYYLVMGGMKRKLASQSAIDANGLNTANAIMTTISYTAGTDITGRESLIADVVSTGSNPVGGAVTVALASDTPAGMTLPKNAASVPLAKFNLTAGSGDATVTSITIHRVGVGAASDFSNVYLYDASGVRLTTGRTINSQTNQAGFTVNLTIPAGTTKSLVVYGDLSNPPSTGGQHSFEISDAASVAVSGSSTVSGSFPVRGNVFTVGTTSAGRLDVAVGAVPSNPIVGASDVEVANFKLTANTNDLKVNSINVYQAGTVSYSDLSNFNLYQGTTVVATASAIDSSGHLLLKFSTPYLISNGTTKVFSLHAKIGGRSTRTIRTYIEYTTDVNATDVVYNSGASVDITTHGSYDGAGFTAGTTGCDTPGNSSCVVTQGGTLSNAFNGPASSNVAKGSLATSLYNFSLTSADNTLTIRNIRFSIAKTSGSPSTCLVKGSAGTNYLRSIKVKNLDTGATVMGPTDLPSGLASSSTASGAMVLSDAFNIAAGQTLNLAIVADLSNTEDTSNGGEFYSSGSCAYQVTFAPFQSNDIQVVDTGEYLALTKVIPNSTVTGNGLTVKSSNLTIALAGSPSSGTIVKKQANVPVAGLVLSAGAQSDITITNLALSCQANIAGGGYTAADCSQRVNSLSLWNGSTQVGTAQAPDTTTGKATISNMNLNIPAGTSVSLTVKASFSSSATASAPFDVVAVGVGAVGDVTAQDNQANTVVPSFFGGAANLNLTTKSVVITVLKNGTLTVNADANPASTIVVAGKDVWIPFAQYSATAQYENISIDRVAVLASSTAGLVADNADYTAVAIAMSGAVKGQDILSAGATGTKDIDLSANPITVPAGSSVDFQLWAKLANVQASSSVSGATTGVARSGNAPAMGLMSGLTTGEWDSTYSGKLNLRSTGAASGELITTAGTNATFGNAMIMRKTVPTVTKQSLSSTTLANIDQNLISFQVAADAQGSAALKQFVLALSKTSNVTLSNFRLSKGSSDMASTDYSVSYVSSTGAVSNIASGSLGSTADGGYIVVSFTNEETISGSGNVYTLHASVSGAGTGDQVTLQFYRPNTTVVTGYLTNKGMSSFSGFASDTSMFNIDSSVAPSTADAAAIGTFLWADKSETPHSPSLGTSGGSRDWSNDVYVQDLSVQQSLSR